MEIAGSVRNGGERRMYARHDEYEKKQNEYK
jgi:hypothetical protein